MRQKGPHKTGMKYVSFEKSHQFYLSDIILKTAVHLQEASRRRQDSGLLKSPVNVI